MVYPRVGQAYQLPIDSNRSSIDDISVLSSHDSCNAARTEGFTGGKGGADITILCIRSSGSRVQLKCFNKDTDGSVTVSSLKLSLPRESSNRVVSAELVSITPKLLLTTVTLTGTLITLDLSRFLVDGHLPEVIPPEVSSRGTGKYSSKNLGSGSSSTLTPPRKVSPSKKKLFDMSVSPKSRSSANNSNPPNTPITPNNANSATSYTMTSNSPANTAGNSGSGGIYSGTTKANVKYDQYHLPHTLTLEQTLKLALSIQDLDLSLDLSLPEREEQNSRDRQNRRNNQRNKSSLTSNSSSSYSPLCMASQRTSRVLPSSLLRRGSKECSSTGRKECSSVGVMKSFIGCPEGHLLISIKQEASLKQPDHSSSSSSSTSSSTWLTPAGHSMIVSGYDIGSLASAAIHIAGYTPSFSNSFKVQGERPHGCAHPALSSHPLLPTHPAHPSHASHPSTSPHTDRNNRAVGSAVNTKNAVRESMKGSMKEDISGLRIVKCCESDIIRICRMESSGGSSPSIRTTAATSTAVAEVEDEASAGDSAGICLLCLDTEEGVFAYFPDYFPVFEGSLEGQRGEQGDMEREKEIEKEEKDKEEVKGRRDRDNEGEAESEEEEDNWRDRESEEEEKEEGDDDEDGRSSSDDNERDGYGRNRITDRTRDRVSGNRSDRKRDKVSRGSDGGNKVDNVLSPALGSLFKLLTPTLHGISIGSFELEMSGQISHRDNFTLDSKARGRRERWVPVRAVTVSLDACGALLGTYTRRSPAVRTLVTEEEESVLKAWGRTRVATTGGEVRREKLVQGVEGGKIDSGKREVEGKQEETERVKEETATEMKAEEEREDQVGVQETGVGTGVGFSVVGVIDVPLGILLLYLLPHSDSSSVSMHDYRDIRGGGDVTNNSKSNRRSCRKDSKRGDVPVSIPLLPFAFVDLKWLVHVNERKNLNMIRGNIPRWECVERVMFLEGVLVVVTNTYANTPVSTPVRVKAPGGAVHAYRSGEKRSEDERRGNESGERRRLSNEGGEKNEERVAAGQAEREEEEVRSVGGTIFTCDLKDGLKVTRCLHLPPGDHSVTAHSLNSTLRDHGSRNESGIGTGSGSGSGCLYVSTSAHVYFIEDVSDRIGPDAPSILVPGNSKEDKMDGMDRNEDRVGHLRAMGEKELELFNSRIGVSRRGSSGISSIPCGDVSGIGMMFKCRESLRKNEHRLLPLMSPLTAPQLILICRDIVTLANQESDILQNIHTNNKGNKRESEEKGKENEKLNVQDLISGVEGKNKNNQTLNPEKKEKETKRRRADELLLLKVSIVTVMLLIKTISDYSARLTLRAEDSHEGSEGSEGREGTGGHGFSSLLLRLKLQLLVLPLSEGRTDEGNTEEVVKDGSDDGQKMVEAAEGSLDEKIEMNENGLKYPYYCSIAASLNSLCSITVEDRSDELKGLRSRLRALSAAQHALAYLLRALTTHYPQPSHFSHQSKVTKVKANAGKINAMKGEKEIEETKVVEEGEGKEEEREMESVWLGVISLCGGLMSSATTSAFVFFSLPLLPISPSPSSSSCTSDMTSSFIERYLSLYSPSYVSLMVSTATERRRERERVRYRGGDSVDKEINELWGIVLHILGEPRPAASTSATDLTGDRSMGYAAFLLSLVLIAWQEGGDIRELERRTLDLIRDESTTRNLCHSSGSSADRGERLRALLRLCLLTWRRDGGVFMGCSCGAADGGNGNNKANNCSNITNTGTEGPPCPYCLSQSPHSLSPHILSPNPLFSPDRLRAVQVSPSFLLSITDRN